MKGLKHLFAYLKSTATLGLCGSVHAANVDPIFHQVSQEDDPDCKDIHKFWEFYVDTDFACNPDRQNKRRSQIGYVAVIKTGERRTPVCWGSKTSSVAFAHADIGEAHADISSGAAEVYGTANATFEFLNLQYVVEEMGMKFPKPFKLHIDNEAAKVFVEGTAFKTKLKHIDCRQFWVQTLRDKNICKPIKVASADNLADLFTKILPPTTFERLRNMIMYDIMK